MFVKSLAVYLLQAKNTTAAAGLAAGAWRGGGSYVCVCRPITTAGGWESGRGTVQRCWGATGGQTGMGFSACTVLTVRLAAGVDEPAAALF